MAIITIRAVIFYIILMMLMKLMGKRQIAEMQVNELVTAFLLSELAVLPVTDTEIPPLHGLVPLVVISCIEVIVAFVCRKNRTVRVFLNGNPITLYRNGRYIQPNLEKARISEEDVEAQVRINGYASLKEVQTVILERTGKMSVIPKNGNPTTNQSGGN